MTDITKELLIFIIILAIGGACYMTIDLPQLKALEENPPSNPTELRTACKVCTSNCNFVPDKYKCLSECDLLVC